MPPLAALVVGKSDGTLPAPPGRRGRSVHPLPVVNGSSRRREDPWIQAAAL
jgi:hypothetical protein